MRAKRLFPFSASPRVLRAAEAFAVCLLWSGSSLLAQGLELSAVAPEIVSAGGPAFTLTVEGTNFVNSSKIQWNGFERATTFISSTRLTASIPASDVASPGTAEVKVFDPAPGGGLSNGKTVNIKGILYFPLVDRAADLYTGFALANVSSASVAASLEAFKNDGTAIGSAASLPIGPNQQQAKLTEEVFTALGATDAGWFRVTYATASVVLKGFFLHGKSDLSTIDGVDVNDRLSTDLIFPLVSETSSGKSRIVLVNPTPIDAKLTLELFSTLGSNEPSASKKLKKENFTLVKMSKLEKSASELFDSAEIAALFPTESAAGQLYIRVKSDVGLFGFQTLPERTSTGDFVALRGQDVARDSGKQVFFAHLAEGSDYETWLSLINLKDASPASIDVTLVLDNGVTQTINKALPANGVLRTKLRDLFSVLGGNQAQVGYVKATSKNDVISGSSVTAGPLMGSLTFKHQSRGATAALPGQTSPSTRLSFSHVAVQDVAVTSHAWLTGIALLNPTVNDTNVKITVRKQDGTDAGVRDNFVLKAGQRVSRLLVELVREVKNQAGGYILVESSQLLFGFELFGDWYLNKLAAVPPQGLDSGRTYTTDADFNLGTLINVNHDPNHHQLQLNTVGVPMHFVNVAISGRGTIVRIDVNTGQILGEYLSAPNGRGRNPSRTTVDQLGNVWVGNRAESSGGKGSVARIGLIIGGTRVNADGTPNVSGQYLKPPFSYNTCVDRNRDGLIKTSQGLTNVLPWSNNDGADTNGGVSTADDECIINYTRVVGTGTRTVAVDANNDLWTGGADNDHEKISGVTGQPVAGTQFNLGCGGYGGFIDKFGILWSARFGSGLLRFETKTLTGQCLGFSVGDYGLAVDPKTGEIWHTFVFGNMVAKLAPDGTLIAKYPHGNHEAQGVAVDNNGNVWVAHSLLGPATTVGHLRTDGTSVGNVTLPGGSGPTGVAVDANGKVWVTNYYSHNAMRIDPNAGPTGGGGLKVGAVDLIVDLGAGAFPYNYSDMTGFVVIGTTSQGTWTIRQDSGVLGYEWGKITWNTEPQGSLPAGAEIVVEARAADTEAGLSSATYIFVSNGLRFSTAGRFIEVRVTLRPSATGQSAVLSDITIGK